MINYEFINEEEDADDIVHIIENTKYVNPNYSDSDSDDSQGSDEGIEGGHGQGGLKKQKLGSNNDKRNGTNVSPIKGSDSPINVSEDRQDGCENFGLQTSLQHRGTANNDKDAASNNDEDAANNDKDAANNDKVLYLIFLD